MKITTLIKKLQAIQKKEKDSDIIIYINQNPVTNIKLLDHKSYYKKGMAGTVYKIE